MRTASGDDRPGSVTQLQLCSIPINYTHRLRAFPVLIFLRCYIRFGPWCPSGPARAVQLRVARLQPPTVCGRLCSLDFGLACNPPLWRSQRVPGLRAPGLTGSSRRSRLALRLVRKRTPLGQGVRLARASLGMRIGKGPRAWRVSGLWVVSIRGSCAAMPCCSSFGLVSDWLAGCHVLLLRLAPCRPRLPVFRGDEQNKKLHSFIFTAYV